MYEILEKEPILKNKIKNFRMKTEEFFCDSYTASLHIYLFLLGQETLKSGSCRGNRGKEEKTELFYDRFNFVEIFF